MTTLKKPPKWKHFSAFRTAAEEDSNTKGFDTRKDDAGDHESATRGRIVRTPGKEQPYKAVLEGDASEHPVATIKEGEALIKRKTPRPAKRDTSGDRSGP